MNDPQQPMPEPESTHADDHATGPMDAASPAEGAPGADGAGATGDGQEPAAAEGAEEHVDLAELADADRRTRAELYGALLAAEADRDEYLDDLRRARAEFDNYRRRVMREGTSQRDAGKADAVSGLLEVLDDLDRTLDAARGSDDPSLAKGVQLVASKLVAALESHGLARIDEVGAVFDPSQHEAVQQVPGDEPSETPTVAQVLRPGYRLGERVLRPAMVAVTA